MITSGQNFVAELFLGFEMKSDKNGFNKMNWKANAPMRGHKPWPKLPCGKKAKGGILFSGHQTLPRTTEGQLDSERCCQKQINLGLFGQFLLRQTFANPFTPHIRAKCLDSFPFSFGNCHDILHRFEAINVNDTYIVKNVLLLLKEKPNSNVLVMEGIT
jgi:hypothetical protein